MRLGILLSLAAMLGGSAAAGCGHPTAPDECNPGPGGISNDRAPSGASSSCAIPQVTEGCRTPVAVQISGGVSPRIDWTPGCGMNHVVVSAAGREGLGGQVVWAFSAEPGLVGPGLQYGVLPAGVFSEGPTRALQAGTTYRVVVEMIVDGAVITGRGISFFTP